MDGTTILMRNRELSVNWLMRLYLYLFTNLTDAEHTKFLPWQKTRNLLLDSVTGSQVKLQEADLKLKLIKLLQGH